MTKYIIILLLFLVFSCKITDFNSQRLIGEYVNTDYSGMKIVLKKRGEFFITSHSIESITPYKCCDTLTCGYWKKDNNEFINLNSVDDYKDKYVKILVNEKYNSNKDTLYFFILNSIENHYIKFREKYKEIEYFVELFSNDKNFDARIGNNAYDTNLIKIPIDKKIVIESFRVLIMPKCDISISNLGIREIYTLEYNIKNKNYNAFDITIPILSYEYINHKRLKDDYVKIKNSYTLLWDGQEYIKRQ